MKHQSVRQGQTTTPGTPCPTLCDKCVGSLTSPANHVTLKMQIQVHVDSRYRMELEAEVIGALPRFTFVTATYQLQKNAIKRLLFTINNI